jgi:hypothetical protein
MEYGLETLATAPLAILGMLILWVSVKARSSKMSDGERLGTAILIAGMGFSLFALYASVALATLVIWLFS